MSLRVISLMFQRAIRLRILVNPVKRQPTVLTRRTLSVLSLAGLTDVVKFQLIGAN